MNAMPIINKRWSSRVAAVCAFLLAISAVLTLVASVEATRLIVKRHRNSKNASRDIPPPRQPSPLMKLSARWDWEPKDGEAVEEATFEKGAGNWNDGGWSGDEDESGIPKPVWIPDPLQPPMPPPPEPPAPLPHKFPMVAEADCKTLEKAMVVDPRPTCERIEVSWGVSDWCQCSIPLPPSINPMPETLGNPFAQEIPPDPNAPKFEPLPTIPPPANPLTPFNAPMMIPECPYSKACPTDDAECVGFNSWGFDKVQMGKYSPASRHFNAIYCFYMMMPYHQFVVPAKIEQHFKNVEAAK